MFERFGRDVRRIVVRAVEQEAPELGSRTVEAEHLLLALAADAGPAGELLGESGLDQQTLRGALELETERSLHAVGVDVSELGQAAAPARTHRSPRFGASAKRALQRAHQLAIANKHRRVSDAHLLVGILRADLGTVPRALAAAEHDRVALLSRGEALVR